MGVNDEQKSSSELDDMEVGKEGIALLQSQQRRDSETDGGKNDNGTSKATDESNDNADEDANASPNVLLEKDDDDRVEKSLQDSGWAWLVALGCFLSHVITGGLERTDGVFFIKLTSHFEASAQVTAWAGALSATIMLSMGPVAGAVCNRFSARASVMAGAVFYAAGLALSGLAPNMPVLLVFFGVVQGLGRGLTYAPGLILVGMYFNRFRGMAVGLGTAGVGAGTFVLPPLVELMFETYGFSGAFLVLGGIAIHFLLVAFLYRPLYMHRRIVLAGRQRPMTCLVEDAQTLPAEIPAPEEPRVDDNKRERTTTIGLSENRTSSRTAHAAVPLGNDNPCKPKNGRTSEAVVGELAGKRRRSHFLKSFLRTCFPVEKQTDGAKRRKLMEWSLLKRPAFLFYCLSMCLFTFSLKSSIVFLPPLAKSRDVSEAHAAYLLSISGVSDTVGRVVTGVVLELRALRRFRLMVYSGFLFTVGALAFAAPFLSSFLHFAFAFAFFGFFTGACAGLKSVVLVDMLGQETLSSSFGIMSFFQGVGNLVGPPLSGVLKDVFGQYNEAFYLGGGTVTLAGVFMVISNVYTASHDHR